MTRIIDNIKLNIARNRIKELKEENRYLTKSLNYHIRDKDKLYKEIDRLEKVIEKKESSHKSK